MEAHINGVNACQLNVYKLDFKNVPLDDV